MYSNTVLTNCGRGATGDNVREGGKELAEVGRKHLEKRMSNGTGIFVPPKNYLSRPQLTRAPGCGPRYKPAKPAGPIRYDKAIATQQPPFRADTWIDFLTAHLKHIGDAARVRLEGDYYKPGMSVCSATRSQQHRNVVRGNGWVVQSTPLDRASLEDETLVTDIRASIPQFQGDPPSPHTPEYKKLIAYLYLASFHPIGTALNMPGSSSASVSSNVTGKIAGAGFDTVCSGETCSGETTPRYEEPWSRWDEEAELRYVRHKNPGRYAAWEQEREDFKKAEEARMEESAEDFARRYGHMGKPRNL